MKKQSNILIIGAGQLGSRYLQGLIPLIDDVKIYVIDPLNSSLENCRKLIFSCIKENHKDIIYLNSIDEINIKNPELVIISSTSQGRAKLISEVKEKIYPKYWIIEKVLEQSIYELENIKNYLSDIKGKAWINNPRRIMHWHIKLKECINSIKNSHGPLEFKYKGINWGLGCNSIHLINLVSWFSGEKVKKVIDRKINKWKPAKRKGYFEPFGSLTFEFNGGSRLFLSCFEGEQKENEIFLKIYNENFFQAEINEFYGKCILSNGEKINGKYELQSEMTSRLVEKILKDGDCSLTPLKESIQEHQILIKTLSESWREFSSLQDENNYAPIT